MKRHILTSALLAALALTAASCDRLDVAGMFWSSGTSTEDRVEEWLQYNEQHCLAPLAAPADTYSFCVCSDIHITDSAPRLGAFLAAAEARSALFAVVNGDIANTRGEAPFRTAADTIGQHPALRCFATLGNHDIYFDCQQHFARHFHTSTYDVVVNTPGGHKDLFLFLDSGNGTHGRLQMQWLRDQLARRDSYRHVVIFTHTCLFRTSYNYSTTPAANLPEEEYYDLLKLMADSRVSLFVMGHFHHKESRNLFGVEYVMTDNLNEDHDTPSFLSVQCADAAVSYQYIDLPANE